MYIKFSDYVIKQTLPFFVWNEKSFFNADFGLNHVVLTHFNQKNISILFFYFQLKKVVSLPHFL